MFLSKDEKIVILLYRIEKIRTWTLLGKYKSYEKGENKIRKLQNKIAKLGGNPKASIKIEIGMK